MTADLRYPIGKFEWIPPENEDQMTKRRVHYTDVLAKLPSDMYSAVTCTRLSKVSARSSSTPRIARRAGQCARLCTMCRRAT